MDKKIVLFSRTSTTQQDVEQQTNALKESAKQLGYPIKNQIIIEYQESGIKLGIDERQGIQRLKEAILINDAINCVICWELTRIGRRGDVIYDIRNFLAERKIRWIVLKPSLVELIDSNGQVTPTMSLMLGIFTSFAESEMGIKRDRFARAKNKLREENKKFAGATIFGYIKDRNKYCIPHPDDSKIIVDLFNYYNSNSDATVYETFKYACSKYPAKFKMLPYHRAHRKMMHIFETEIYGYGNWCYPPLISKELYDKTREKMSKAKCQARYESKCQILGVELKAKGEELKDTDVLQIIQKTLKELGDEKVDYLKVNNQERVESISQQEIILKKYLPQQMTKEEILAEIDKLEDKSIPNIMKHFKANFLGKVDMSLVNQIARGL